MKCDCCGCCKTEEQIKEEIKRIKLILEGTRNKELEGLLTEKILGLRWVITKCKEWVRPVEMKSDGKIISVQLRISQGIELFDDYYHALNHSGLITIRK